jgi:hypothetical protein
VWNCECIPPADYTLKSYYPEMQFEGRLLYPVYMYTIFYKYINVLKSTDAAALVRFIGAGILGILAYVIFCILRGSRFRPSHAFLLGIIICTLPPFQVYVGRLNNVGIFIPGALMTMLAALIMLKPVYAEEIQQTTHIVSHVLLSVVLLFLSMCIYQPVALSYWVMALVPLTTLKDEDFIKRRYSLGIYFFTGLTAMISYFVSMKVIIRYVLDERYYLSFNKGVLIGMADIYPKLVWFIQYPFYTALNLWNIFPKKAVAMLVVAVLLAGMLSGIARNVLQMKKERRDLELLSILICRYLLILIVVPLSFVSHLVITQSINVMVIKHSVIIGLQMSMIFLCYRSIMNIAEMAENIFTISPGLMKHMVTFVLITVAVGATFIANHNVKKYFATLQKDEFTYIKNAIQEHGVSRIKKNKKIYFIHPDSDPSKFYSEFTQLSSWGFGRHMIRLALYELGVNPDTITVSGIGGGDNSLSASNDDQLIINMMDFQKKEYHGLDIPPNLHEIVQPFF